MSKKRETLAEAWAAKQVPGELPAVAITWHTATDLPPRSDNNLPPLRTLLVALRSPLCDGRAIRRIQFGRYVHYLGQWKIDGSIENWDVEWWAELPEVPGENR